MSHCEMERERKKEEGKKEREGREEHKAEMHEEVKESHAYKIRWKPLFSWADRDF